MDVVKTLEGGERLTAGSSSGGPLDERGYEQQRGYLPALRIY